MIVFSLGPAEPVQLPVPLPLPPPPIPTLTRDQAMVSRRRILSRSRDDLHLDAAFQPPDDEEDVWYQKDKLYKVSHQYSFSVI